MGTIRAYPRGWTGMVVGSCCVLLILPLTVKAQRSSTRPASFDQATINAAMEKLRVRQSERESAATQPAGLSKKLTDQELQERKWNDLLELMARVELESSLFIQNTTIRTSIVDGQVKTTLPDTDKFSVVAGSHLMSLQQIKQNFQVPIGAAPVAKQFRDLIERMVVSLQHRISTWEQYRNLDDLAYKRPEIWKRLMEEAIQKDAEDQTIYRNAVEGIQSLLDTLAVQHGTTSEIVVSKYAAKIGGKDADEANLQAKLDTMLKASIAAGIIKSIDESKQETVVDRSTWLALTSEMKAFYLVTLSERFKAKSGLATVRILSTDANPVELGFYDGDKVIRVVK